MSHFAGVRFCWIGMSIVLLATEAAAEKFFTASNNTGDRKVRRFDTSSLSGGAPTAEAVFSGGGLSQPWGAAFGPDGKLYLADNSGKVVRIDDPMGPGDAGVTVATGLSTPHGIAFLGDEAFVVQIGGSGDIARFLLDGGALVPNGTIPATTQARGAAVSPWGELFVSVYSTNRVRRFTFDGGAAVANGEMTGNGLSSPHDLEFGPGGELFVMNHSTSISRFTFDGGVAIANGSVPAAYNGAMMLGLSSGGELFVSSESTPEVWRFVLDGGALVPNGSFDGGARVADIEFPSASNPVVQPPADGGTTQDGGTADDAGTTTSSASDGGSGVSLPGCSCASSPSSLWWMLGFALALVPLTRRFGRLRRSR